MPYFLANALKANMKPYTLEASNIAVPLSASLITGFITAKFYLINILLLFIHSSSGKKGP